jgi:menaquinone-dependent protoporphyrinogen oxidase
MAKFLIVYGSQEGQTEKIANHMAELFRNANHTADLFYGKDVPDEFSMSSYDGVVVGASIHIGKHQKYMVKFAKRYSDQLASKFSAFFSVCLTAKSGTLEDKTQVEQYLEDFMDTSGWQPDQIGVFAGALLYTQYGLIKRYLMKTISKQMEGDTDVSRDYDYTDWESVDDFAEIFMTSVAGEPVLAGD